MTFVDYGFSIIVIISSLLGCYRGFVRELLAIVAWFFAFYLAQSFSPLLALKLHWIDTESIRSLAAYVLIFIAVLIASMGVIAILNKFIKYTGLTLPNILMGGLFGFIRAFLIGLICHLVIQSTSFEKHEVWQNARIKPYFESFAAKAGVYLPLDILKHVKYSQRTYF
ncbi:MAG: CvpA family protein [Candidatus Methylopumilus sp.]|nr:CvpA family protein [Candidatus Methylopumilus sp.]